MISKLLVALLIGAGAILFFTTRTQEVSAPAKSPTAGVVDVDAQKKSRQRFYQKMISDLEKQTRRSPADDKKLAQYRKELNSL